MSEREIMTWDIFGVASRELATSVAESGYEPDIILAIARGGLRRTAASVTGFHRAPCRRRGGRRGSGGRALARGAEGSLAPASPGTLAPQTAPPSGLGARRDGPRPRPRARL